MTEQLQAMEAKFKQVGLPYHDLHVFGTLRINVHVRCVGRETAAKWTDVLAQVFPKTRVACVQTRWYAQQNRGTVLLPTNVEGWLIAVAA